MKINDKIYLRPDVETIASWEQLKSFRIDLAKDTAYLITCTDSYTYHTNGHNTKTKVLGTNLTNCFKPKEWFITEAEYLAQEGNGKEPKFIEGRWYSCTGWSGVMYGKFSHLKDPMFECQECIVHGVLTDQKHFHNNAGKWDTFREVPLEEIQQYLPEGHVDRLPSDIEEKWIPKVGEWVAIIGGAYATDEVSQVKKKSEFESNAYVIDTPYRLCPTVEIFNLRKATPEEIASITKPKDEIPFGYPLNNVILIEDSKEPAEQELINEAIRRGFVEGATYIGTTDSENTITDSELNGFSVYGKAHLGYRGHLGYVYDNGKWATIITPAPCKSPVVTSKEYSEKSIAWLGEMMQESIIYPEHREMGQYIYNMIDIASPQVEPNKKPLTYGELISAVENIGKFERHKEATQDEQPILISKVKTSNKIIVL